MMKRIGYVLGIVLAALIQVRFLPELGLERLVNLPTVLLIVTASIERRTLALVAATLAGLVIDITLLRPLGLSSLAMVGLVDQLTKVALHLAHYVAAQFRAGIKHGQEEAVHL